MLQLVNIFTFDAQKMLIFAMEAPLRILLLKQSNPSLWSMVTSLMDHNEDRFEDKTEHGVVGLIRVILKGHLC